MGALSVLIFLCALVSRYKSATCRGQWYQDTAHFSPQTPPALVVPSSSLRQLNWKCVFFRAGSDKHVLFLGQVVPDYKQSLPGDNVADKANNMRARLQRYLGQHAPAADTGGTERQTQMHMLRCSDHALQTVTAGQLSISNFMVQNEVRALGPTEKRYYRLASELPRSVCSRGQKRRACVLDTETKKRRLEFIATDDDEWSLHLRADRGPGWIGFFPLYASLPCNGTFFDEPHKNWDDCRNSGNEAGLSLLTGSLLIMLNCTSGPYGGAAFYRQLVQCSKQFFQHCTPEGLFFLRWYEDVWWESSQTRREFGDPEAMRQLIDVCRSAKPFQAKGAKVKMSRWFSFIDRLEEFIPHWWKVAAMLSLLALDKHTFRNMEDLEGAAKAHLTRRPDADEAQPADEGDVARVELADVKKGKRMDPIAIIRVSVCTLASRFTRSLAVMMCKVLTPIRKHHGELLILQKTQRGTEDPCASSEHFYLPHTIHDVLFSHSDQSSVRSLDIVQCILIF